MCRFAFFLVLLASALVLSACGDDETDSDSSTSSYQAPEPTGEQFAESDPEHGKTLFATWRCADCHGENAQGQVGSALAATTLNFDAFSLAVRETRPPKPAFSEAELSDGDLRDIYAWVQTLPASTEVAEVAELPSGEVLGMSVWTDNGCDSCHGAFAQGSADAPALADTSLSREEFLAMLREDAGTIEAHSVDAISDEWAARLHRWLAEGASITGGC
jgi:mono/diheme cytochrome c family protein